MNHYEFDNFEIGLSVSFTSHITNEKMQQFFNICGDDNPLHMEDSYARQKGFDSRVVYGMLTSAMYSTLVGVYLPGEKCILKSVKILFQNPVYVNDILTVSGIVKEKDERFQQAVIKAKIINQNKRTVSKAEILVGFL